MYIFVINCVKDHSCETRDGVYHVSAYSFLHFRGGKEKLKFGSSFLLPREDKNEAFRRSQRDSLLGNSEALPPSPFSVSSPLISLFISSVNRLEQTETAGPSFDNRGEGTAGSARSLIGQHLGAFSDGNGSFVAITVVCDGFTVFYVVVYHLRTEQGSYGASGS